MKLKFMLVDCRIKMFPMPWLEKPRALGKRSFLNDRDVILNARETLEDAE